MMKYTTGNILSMPEMARVDPIYSENLQNGKTLDLDRELLDG